MMFVNENRQTIRKRKISIGISDGGYPFPLICPWVLKDTKKTQTYPDRFLSVEELQDGATLQQLLSSYEIVGCFVATQLPDYSILEQLPDLRYLTITNTHGGLKDLSFTRALLHCRLLHLEDADLPDLNDLLYAKRMGGSHCFSCLSLLDCHITDLSSLQNGNSYFTELLIAGVEKADDKSRWKKIAARKFRYFEYPNYRKALIEDVFAMIQQFAIPAVADSELISQLASQTEQEV